MMTYFWCESKVGLFQFLSALKRESYFRLEFLSLPIIAHHLVHQHGFHLGLQAKKGSSISSQQLFTLHEGLAVF